MTDSITVLGESPLVPPEGTPTGRVQSPVWAWVRKQRALPAFIGALAVWIATATLAGHGAFNTLTSGIAIGTFLLIVGIGQMFVITTGNGGIDLSVPYVMTLSAYLSSSIMNGQDGGLLLGVLVAVVVGLVIGTINILLIEVIFMPPIIATLAVGFVLQTVTFLLAGNALGAPSPLLVSFVSGRTGAIPNLALLGIALAIIFTLVLTRTPYGRSIQALGQSEEASRLSGVKTRRVRVIAYLVCSIAAGISGFLLAGYSGGPSLTMGSAYQLSSIAVVVLGGSIIAGGMSNVPGIWAATLLLTLLITLVNVAHLGQGMQDIVQGVLIVSVLAVGGARRLKT